jgi:hypothetical protein
MSDSGDRIPVTAHDEAFIGSFLGAWVGFMAAVIAALLGGATSSALRNQPEIVNQIASGIAAAVGGVLVPRGMAGMARPWRTSLIWLALGAAAAVSLSYAIGSRFEWSFYRWGLAGAALGIVFGAHSQASAATRGKALPVDDRFSFVILAGIVIGTVVSNFNARLPGVMLAGALGGALGALFPGWIIHEAGGREATEVFGDSYPLIWTSMALGAAGGILGAIGLWRFRRAREALGQVIEEQTCP